MVGKRTIFTPDDESLSVPCIVPALVRSSTSGLGRAAVGVSVAEVESLCADLVAVGLIEPVVEH